MTMSDDLVRSYLAGDYAEAVRFYDARARSAKLGYRICSVYVIVASTAVTLGAAFAPDKLGLRILCAVLSGMVAVASGLLAHFKWHEDWLSYRGTWDALERERRLYETGTGHYAATDDKGRQFIERVEALRSGEGGDFYARHAKAATSDGADKARKLR